MKQSNNMNTKSKFKSKSPRKSVTFLCFIPNRLKTKFIKNSLEAEREDEHEKQIQIENLTKIGKLSMLYYK